MMKIILLGGFLGSGKTTVLLRLAADLLSDAPMSDSAESAAPPIGSVRVMIIENEIGDIGIDDKILRNQGLQVRELFSGCACCTSGGDLLQDIDRIYREINPEWLIIEATGVAYPRAIRDKITELFDLRVKILAIADAERWKRLQNAMSELISAQLDGADVILLNKTDTIDSDSADELVSEITAINPAAEIHKVSAKYKNISSEIRRILL
ncbi:MAG: cobalamin biosynthesis protein P47K [Oscillospiraceae bacterium]|jgi:G3E family GTPase|nr:cobalamin biosynthesis protein P47K [Oscillospiraceae bacterium]